MTQFTVTITDPAHLAGIASAREAFNATLTLSPGSPAQGEEGAEGYVPAVAAQTLEAHPDFVASDEAYVQFVMGRAAESYARQYG